MQENQDGESVTVYELNADSVLVPIYLRVWFLEHYFAPEFAKPKYYGGTALGWLRDLTDEG